MPDPDPNTGPIPPSDRKYTGLQIGPYRLLEIIGEGGFGIVWKAQRKEPYDQIVALKMIKPGMGSDEVLARFEHERQALALMSHPAVAVVLDGGVTSPEMGDRPYFVMEYVPGEPITRYCDEHKLSIRERLELFILVCEGVQHAHSKGIIHRDLTPRNILVIEHDNKPQPKIIDFGISKALGRPLTDKTFFTHEGHPLGVPEYMCPEQAQGIDIDTRADVYTLGVLLYELLTGAPPFDRTQLLSRGWEAMLRFIRDAERPHPSTRLSSLGDSLGEIARRRAARPESLVDELARGLGWIPLRALEAERNRRYQTPIDLAADVRRYLNDDYDPPFGGRALDRARRFVRRNRRVLAVTGLVVGALAVWLAGTLYQLGETRIARADAIKEAKAARAAELQAQQEAYDANIAAAGAFVIAKDSQAARAKLDRCDAAKREWEWRMLGRLAGAHTQTNTSFSGPLLWTDFDRRDGALVAVTIDTRYRLDGSSLIQLSGKGAAVQFLDDKARSSVNGAERVLGGLESGDRVLLLHTLDARSDELRMLNPTDGSRHPVDLGVGLRLDHSAAPRATPDADVVAVPVVNEQSESALLVTGRATRALIPLDHPPRVVAVSRDGRLAAAAWNTERGGIMVHAWEVGQPRAIVQRSSDDVGELADLSIDAGSIAASGDRGVAVWSFGEGAVEDPTFVPGKSGVVAVDSARGWLAVAEGRDLRLQNLKTGDRSTLLGHREPITTLAFSPRGDGIVAGSTNSAVVRRWNVEADDFNSGVASLAGAWSDSSGSRLLLLGGGAAPALRLFETGTKTLTDLTVDDPAGVRSCAISDDGSRFAILRSARVELWQVQPQSLVRAWTASESSIDDGPEEGQGHRQRLGFAPGSNARLFAAAMPQMATTGLETRIVSLDATTGAVSVVVKIPQQLDGIPTVMSASSPNSVIAASLFQMFTWSRAGGNTPVAVEGQDAPAGIAASPAGDLAAVLGAPGNVYLVPTGGGEVKEFVTGHQPHGRSIVWLGDDRRLATGASDGSVIIWGTNPLRTLCVVRIDAGVVGLAYQYAAQTLWVADEAGRIHRFSGEP